MFASQNTTFKIISGLLTGLMLLLAVFIFVCPMAGMSNIPTASSSVSALCPGHAAGSALLSGMNASGNCLGFHLSIIEQFTRALFEKVNVFFVVLLAAFGLGSLILRTDPFAALGARLTNFRQRFYNNFQIRQKFQKNFLAWLMVINSYSI